jgi:hypothetical protein
MAQFKKHFTLAEARALLPELRQVFAQAQACHARLQQADDILAKQAEQICTDRGGCDVNAMLRHLAEMKRFAGQLENLGVVVKDLDRGLVDFPHLRDGEEVFLCWELDEDDIEFWHPLETGYAGRERL